LIGVFFNLEYGIITSQIGLRISFTNYHEYNIKIFAIIRGVIRDNIYDL